jgi:hypothetical protein
VVQGQDHPLIGLEASKPALDLVAVGHRADVVGCPGRIGVIGQQLDDRPASRTTALALGERHAVPGDHPIRPCLEPIRVPEAWQLIPDRDEGLLHRILRSMVVAQDPVCDREETVRGRAHQRLEGLLVAARGSFHQISLQFPCLLLWSVVPGVVAHRV